MEYVRGLEDYDFKNIYTQRKQNDGPVAIRFDINSPVAKNGRIFQNGEVNLRLEENAYLLKAYSKLGPLILLAHQGRKNPPDRKQDPNFVNLLDHHYILARYSGMRIHFIEWIEGETWDEYSKNIEKRVKRVKKGEAILLDNTRIWDFEKNFNPEKCPYINFFKEINLSAFINDAIPVWHREDSSIMFGRHIAPTFIGHISMKELRIQRKIINENTKKVIIIGGLKPKFEAISKLVQMMDVFTGGVTGILTAYLSGYEVGEQNDILLNDIFKGLEKKVKKYESILEDNKILHPVDFIVSQTNNISKNNRFNVPLEDLSKPKYEDYMIFDIGSETVKLYSKIIHNERYGWRIRAGPNGVFEEGFDNGINLIENILGTGFVAIGGDTIEELQRSGICKPIMYSDGAILLGGGSHINGFADIPYPCVEDLLLNGNGRSFQ
jgi:3-phosphoglycerate kinase